MALAYIRIIPVCFAHSTLHLLGSAGRSLSEKHAAVEHLDPRLPGREVSQLKYEIQGQPGETSFSSVFRGKEIWLSKRDPRSQGDFE